MKRTIKLIKDAMQVSLPLAFIAACSGYQSTHSTPTPTQRTSPTETFRNLPPTADSKVLNQFVLEEIVARKWEYADHLFTRLAVFSMVSSGESFAFVT